MNMEQDSEEKRTLMLPKMIFIFVKNNMSNPLIYKGLQNSFYSKKSLIRYAIGALIAIAAFFFALSVAAEMRANIWQSASAAGGDLFIGALIVLLVFINFVGPLVGASEIANERERGTFSLLQTSHLSAGEIVFGKWAALGVKWTVFMLVAMPVLSICLFYEGLSLSYFIVGILLLYIVGLSSFSMGILASSAFESVKNATAAAFMMAVAQALILWNLSFVFFETMGRNMGSQRLEIIFLVASLSLYMLISSLVAARSLIAPKSASRMVYRAFLRRVLLLGAPILFSCLSFSLGSSETRKEATVFSWVAVLALMSFAALFEGAAAAWNRPRAGDASSAYQAIRTVFIECFIGLLLASIPMAYLSDLYVFGIDNNAPSLVGQLALGPFMALLVGAFALASAVASVAAWTAFFGAFLKRPAFKIFAAIFVIGALLVLPFIAGGIAAEFGLRAFIPGLWMNPLVQFLSAGCFDVDSRLMQDAQFLGHYPAVVGGILLTGLFNVIVAVKGRKSYLK